MAIKGSPRTRWAILTIIMLAVVAGATFLVLRTMPPRVITMATGAEGGAYNEVGKRYRELLAREGIELRLVQTSGALENLALLRDRRSGVGVGLLQGGITSESAAPEVEALGTIFYEPLWLFQRSELRGSALEALRGKKISVGPEGRGTRAVALELLKRNGLDRQAGEAACAHDATGERQAPGGRDRRRAAAGLVRFAGGASADRRRSHYRR
jgi:TRAP-type uncharacterized transport system substrate-binding protein